MKIPEFKTMPTVIFAHKLTAENHHAWLEWPEGALEISAIIEGYIDVSTKDHKYGRVVSGDILTNYHKVPLRVDTDAHHVHLTTAFTFDTAESFEEIPLITRAENGTSQIIRLLNEIIRVHTLYPDDTLRTTGLFLQMLGELCMCGEGSSACSPGDRLYVKRAKEYIYEHITEPVMQKNVASHLGITPEYLCTIFKKTDGRSVIRFINEVKLDNVRNLMETRNIPLWQAAAQYGFSDPNYVSKLYKKYYNENITHHKRKMT
ncbi:MAG: helix-turn-helix transcriptional regulator [Clostridia bacterium]|nr:helix-turn-helix transcriptional regulator [Clostridia bacterium]